MKQTLLNDAIELGSVALKIKDLKASIAFYTEVLGLKVLKESESYAVLGVTSPLVELHEDSNAVQGISNQSGLYHLAILLPSAEALGQFIIHLYRIGFEVDGAGDHLYSEAIYLHDVDGNGIEIYADRPRDQWTIHEDGTIESGTFPVDVQGLVDKVEVENWVGFPDGTRMGHVHLQVLDVPEFERFYRDVLGFERVTTMPRASFISKNGYHHHIAGNAWHQAKTPRNDNAVGLLHYTIGVNNMDSIKATLEGAVDSYMRDGDFYVIDPSKITIRFTEDISKY